MRTLLFKDLTECLGAIRVSVHANQNRIGFKVVRQAPFREVLRKLEGAKV